MSQHGAISPIALSSSRVRDPTGLAKVSRLCQRVMDPLGAVHILNLTPLTIPPPYLNDEGPQFLVDSVCVR